MGKSLWLPLLIAILLGAFAFGCDKGNVRPDRPFDVLRGLRADLNEAGMDCDYREGDFRELSCIGERSYRVLITYLPESKRLRFMSLFSLTVPCDELTLELMDYNWGWAINQAACDADAIAFSTTTLVPENGLTGTELREYIEWWHATLTASLKASALWAVLS